VVQAIAGHDSCRAAELLGSDDGERPLVAGGVAASAGFVIQSVYGVYWVSRSIKSERAQAIADLNDRIRKAMNGHRRNFTAALATMQYRDHVLSIAPFPYSGSVGAAVNVLRFAPTVVALAHLLWDVKWS
jgi:hypothetical protein